MHELVERVLALRPDTVVKGRLVKGVKAARHRVSLFAALHARG